MPTRKPKQNDKLKPVAEAKLEYTHHEHSIEIPGALPSSHHADRDYEAKLSALRPAIDEGEPVLRIRSTIRAHRTKL
jgi:hypothetical protein